MARLHAAPAVAGRLRGPRLLDVRFGALADAQGAAFVPFAVPNDPRLVGLALNFLWLVIDAGSVSPLGIAFTNGGSSSF